MRHNSKLPEVRKSPAVALNATTDLMPSMAPITPFAMLAQAVTSGANPDLIGRLMDLAERHEKNIARKAFEAAIAAAKAEIPVIKKNRHVGFRSRDPNKGSTEYDHEDFAEVARTIDPILGKHGLSYRFRVEQLDGKISVICVIAHRDGHSEKNTLWAPADDSGNKNSIQAVGSTITYLQRYSLKAALGLAASKDDDASRAERPEDGPISQEQLNELLNIADDLNVDKIKFCGFFKINSVAELPAKKFAQAKRMIESKKKEKPRDDANN